MQQAATTKELRVLMLEDTPTDAELMEYELRRAGFVFIARRVETRDAFAKALDEFRPDIVLSDYNLPSFNGLDALRMVRSDYPDVPVIMVTGALPDVKAVELIHAGAHDYVLKDGLARLAPSIKRVLSDEEDIRNRKLAEGKYRALFSEAMDGIVLIDCETWQIADCNPEFERQTGRTLPQLRTLKVWEVLRPEQYDLARQSLLDIQSVEKWRGSDFILQKPDGELVPIDVSAKFLRIQRQTFIQGISRDITERKQAEARLRASEEKHRLLFESSRDALITLAPPSWKFTNANMAALQLFGVTSISEFTELGPWDLSPALQPDGRSSSERVQEMLAIAMREGSHFFDWEHQNIDGNRFASDVLLTRMTIGEEVFLQGTVRDITERRRAERALRESEDKFRSITASAQDAILVLDSEGRIACWNAAAEKTFGYRIQEAMGQQLHALIAPERFRNDFVKGFTHFVESGEGPIVGKTIEVAALNKDGTEFPVELSLSAIERDGAWNAIGILRDITERKRAEGALRRANRALRTLSAGNLVLVRAVDEDELLHEATRVIVEEGGYCLAVVDYVEYDPDKSITPIAWSGMDESRYWAQHLSWADTERGQLPVAKAIRSSTTQICTDIANDPAFEPWREDVLARGYKSNIALPLCKDGGVFGGLSIYSRDLDAFDEEEVRLLEELANDLAYGIGTLRTRREFEQHAIVLRQSLEQSVQTIAATVEARDPYTAGHQRRVGELATRIAREMGLPEDQISGIHLAAIIHDVGKIKIPAEILSKPTKLTEVEFTFIKTHAQAGYEILKNINFPWPIAEIILQHHEKLDGSGYPQGLKDEQILLEAKILTVADVVEAISSHRPYRPSLGIEVALAEIERFRGVYYDTRAVDVCIRLFRELGYTLPT